MTQDIGKQRQNLKDQFYTKESKAALCVETLLEVLPDCVSWLWIEPSAGKGSFVKAVPGGISKLAIDIEPKGEGITQADFLSWTPPSQRSIVFGNPPFGRQGSLAKAFIKKAATFADGIAFILPRSFQKISMNRCFPPKFHLIHTIQMDPASFEVNGNEYSLPCIFQIWQKKNEDRILFKPPSEEPIGFTYKKSTESYHLAVRRVGGKAGTAFLPPGDFNPQCFYYLSFSNPLLAKTIQDGINRYHFPHNTTGPRSLSKPEITRVVNSILQSL